MAAGWRAEPVRLPNQCVFPATVLSESCAGEAVVELAAGLVVAPARLAPGVMAALEPELVAEVALGAVAAPAVVAEVAPGVLAAPAAWDSSEFDSSSNSSLICARRSCRRLFFAILAKIARNSAASRRISGVEIQRSPMAWRTGRGDLADWRTGEPNLMALAIVLVSQRWQ